MIDVLERIKQLRDAKGWTNYRLMSEAQLNVSTLQNMFTRKTMSSINTLNAICEALNISLAQFFNENEQHTILTDDEKQLLDTYRQLNKKNQNIVQTLTKELC